MSEASLGKWVLFATLVVFGAAACSDDDDTSPNGTAGSAGKGGSGGSGGSAGKGGSGGDAAGSGALAGEGGTAGHGGEGGVAGEGGVTPCSGECPAVEYCGPLDIEARCDGKPNSCPSFDDVTTAESCGNARSVTVSDTTCGGKLVVVEYGLGSDTFGYDTDGALEYIRIDSDQDTTCADGKGHSASTVWGELPCDTTGAGAEVCGAGGAGGSGGAP